MHNEYYGHGFLIPVISAFFIWRHRDKLETGSFSPYWIVFFVLGLVVYVIGFVRGMQFLSALSLPIVLAALVLHFYGQNALRAMAFPIVFLLFMIPPPFLSSMGWELQRISTEGSTLLSKATPLEVTATGTTLIMNGNPFNVGLPCSGMHSLISLLALAAVLAYVLTGSWPKKVTLFISTIPIAIVANSMRIVSLLLVANYYGIEAADTDAPFHSISSVLLFLVALIALILLSRALGLSLLPSPGKESADEVS